MMFLQFNLSLYFCRIICSISGVDFRPMCFLPTHTDVVEEHLTTGRQVACESLNETGGHFTETGARLTNTCKRLTEPG
ncbi:hypothetical protein DPMN_155915 [Dreissena polymorpha]|uniref:Secreted protein n=1 Tax=Dreissena polymorpha TaxID=45954 RepID=A0A9D4FPQ4_DREPO|nr:hypothetical protein DPMN_155915 [Dreissena polymorpha]